MADLDGAYEQHPDRKNRRIIELMAESAFEQFQRFGVNLSGLHNLTPTLSVSAEESAQMAEKLANLPKPWIAVVPKSGSWANKTVDRLVWADVKAPGTLIWTGLDPAPAGYADFRLRSFRQLMALISVCDLCLSVDTGPLHVAAALKIPTVAIEQAFSIERHILGKQTDWTGVGARLECLGCCEQVCKLSPEASPLCAYPFPDDLSEAISDKWETVSGNRVSAIIPVYRPHERLLRCIDAVIDQVDEVLVSLDAGADVSDLIPDHPKIRVIPSTGKRTGCGHTLARAARHARGRYLLLLNDDAYADPGSVKVLVDAMEPKVAVVGALTRYANGLTYHGGTFRIPGHNGWGHIDHMKPSSKPTIRVRTEMEFVNLAFALVRREAYFDVRGFDERYDCYSEDNDFCLAVRKAGWRVMYEPAATAIHDESQSTTGEEKLKLLADGNRKFMEKWGWYFQHNRNNQLGTFQ
jgi:GT2 family glycosyltransferase